MEPKRFASRDVTGMPGNPLVRMSVQHKGVQLYVQAHHLVEVRNALSVRLLGGNRWESPVWFARVDSTENGELPETEV